MEKDNLDTLGRIFNIQRFSVHDGPGIRTIVFLKGCFMRCKWCCNPESQEYKIQTMLENGKEKTVGEDVTVRSVLETVERDRPYYSRSGGGMTLSGGECMCQPRFTLALLKECKNRGINTAIETTANAQEHIVREIVPFADTVLMDIKHMNSQKHKAFTGVLNEMILDNARVISQIAKQLIIRVPVIPGFNDTEDEIYEIARFAKSLSGVEKIHLLPYHNFGMDKYEGLGRNYELKDLTPPGGEHMKKLEAVAAACGLDAQIGG